MQISRVLPDQLEPVWAEALPMIKRGLRHGEGDGLTADYIKQQVSIGNWEMLAAHDGKLIHAVVVIRIVEHPAKRTLFIVMLAGKEIDAWIDAGERVLIEAMKLSEADTLEASCRPGLAKYLKRRGWKQKAIVMQKELVH